MRTNTSKFGGAHVAALDERKARATRVNDLIKGVGKVDTE
jgi:hypothetical protein